MEIKENKDKDKYTTKQRIDKELELMGAIESEYKRLGRDISLIAEHYHSKISKLKEQLKEVEDDEGRK
jgi:phage host-nuclease inhibitor protein Gam